jgi:hypothetical protein
MLHAEKRKEEVTQLVNEIQLNFGRDTGNEIEQLHLRLVELGYEHVSLSLRAEGAKQTGDIVEALKRYSSLMALLPRNDPRSCVSMERYAVLLMEGWQIAEAEAVCSRILKINPNHPVHLHMKDLQQVAELVEKENWVIEPDVPIHRIIESATVIKKRFSGRYVIKKRSAQSCSQTRLEPEAVIEKYGLIKKEPNNQKLPAATIETLWWISRKENSQGTMITFGTGSTNTIRGLQFAVQVLYADLDTIVVPVVLFDWRDADTDGDPEKENAKASSALAAILNKPVANSYLAALHKAVNEALSRLVTENISQRRDKR